MRLFNALTMTAALTICAASLSGCWLMVAGASAEGAYVATQEERTTSETLTDQRITSTIKTLMLADSDVSGMDINVDTFKGNVTLRGFVRKSSEEEAAIRIARSVSGVKDVVSKIALQ